MMTMPPTIENLWPLDTTFPEINPQRIPNQNSKRPMIKTDNIAQQKHIVITPLAYCFCTIIETIDSGQVLILIGIAYHFFPRETWDAFLVPPEPVYLAYREKQC